LLLDSKNFLFVVLLVVS